ncbi:hypothetical protein THAOC_33919, partial [Thalassiosira oceanica]
ARADAAVPVVAGRPAVVVGDGPLRVTPETGRQEPQVDVPLRARVGHRGDFPPPRPRRGGCSPSRWGPGGAPGNAAAAVPAHVHLGNADGQRPAQEGRAEGRPARRVRRRGHPSRVSPS